MGVRGLGEGTCVLQIVRKEKKEKKKLLRNIFHIISCVKLIFVASLRSLYLFILLFLVNQNKTCNLNKGKADKEKK